MEPRAVIKPFDVVEDVELRLRTRAEAVVVEPLGLECVEEALDDSVVETVPRPAHAAEHAVAIEEVLIVGTEVLASTIGVMKQPRSWSAISDGIAKRLDRQALIRTRARRPTDATAREEIENDGEVKPALVGTHLRDVGSPDAVGCWGLEVSIEEVGSCGEILVLGGGEAESLGGPAPQALQTHEPGDTMATDTMSVLAKSVVDPRRAVCASVLAVDETNALDQSSIGLLAITRRSTQPGVEATTGDLEHHAHLAYPEGLPVFLDEAELHFCSSAK